MMGALRRGARPIWRLARRIPGLQRLRHDLRLLRLYGTPRPERIDLRPPSEGTLFVDPREARGRALLLTRAAGQPRIKEVWRAARDLLAPTVALDVGLNYGEILFGTPFADGTHLIGIEAAPTLIPWLERTADACRHAGPVAVHHALADQLPGEGQFFYDPAWSGRSSAVAPSDDLRALTVPRVVVDDLLDDAPDGPLLFKIDVEGFEPRVLAGMTRHLARRPHIGIIELSVSRWLRALEAPPDAGDAPVDAVLATLHVRAYIDGAGLHPLETPTLAALRAARGLPADADIEGDLVLASDPGHLPALLDATRAEGSD